MTLSNRREFLGKAAAAGVGVATAGALAACGSSSGVSQTGGSPQSQTGDAPRRGGTLTAGVTGGSSSDTLDGQNYITLIDNARAYALYNSLAAFDDDAHVQLSLAKELSPNATATEWTVRLKSGITFHDGKPLTADDVIFSLQRITDKKKPLVGATSLAAVDIAGMKKLDNLTVRIPCHYPFAALAEVLASYEFFVVPVGFNPKEPVGTGPFKLESFVPGQSSVFLRNENYWESGLPYLDRLVINDYADETSQLNALQSGQLNAISPLSATSISILGATGAQVRIANGGGIQPFTMRVDQPPFNDVRVRQAMRLVVDRPQMLKTLYAGHGTLGNDLFSLWDPAYDHSLPQRVQDIDQAKSLLKQAGHAGLEVTLTTSAIAQGTVLVAQQYAQQAAQAGIKVNLRQVTPTAFYANYLQWPFAQDYWNYYPYSAQVLQEMVPSAPFNECHLDDPKYLKLFRQAMATLNATKRHEIVHEMQAREYDGVSSGLIVPYFSPTIDGYASNVRGWVQNRTGGSFSGYNFSRFWLA